MKKRFLNLLIAIDQLLWVVITLGGGYPDETISAAMYRYEMDGKLIGKIFRPIIDKLFWFHEKHCENSFLNEIGDMQLPDSYRKKE
jgi:hypothetical protein